MKKIFALFALFAVVAGTGVAAFAWWDQVEQSDEVTLSIGKGVTMSVSLEDQTEGNLVPEGVIMKTGDVTSVVVEFDLVMDVDAGVFDLVVTYDNVLINGLATHVGLVNITVGGATTITGTTPSTVTFTVTLTKPGSEEAYNAIINQDITFDVSFEAVQN